MVAIEENNACITDALMVYLSMTIVPHVETIEGFNDRREIVYVNAQIEADFRLKDKSISKVSFRAMTTGDYSPLLGKGETGAVCLKKVMREIKNVYRVDEYYLEFDPSVPEHWEEAIDKFIYENQEKPENA